MAQGDAQWSKALLSTAGVHVEMRESVPAFYEQLREAYSDTVTTARLHELAMHRDSAVREAVARRVTCPIGVLAALADDAAEEVRVAAVSNPRAVRAIFEHVMVDKSPRVLRAVAHHDSAPLDLIEMLAKHKKKKVRKAAQGRLDAMSGARTAGGDQVPELVDRVAPPHEVQALARARQQRTLAPRPSVPSRTG